MKVFKVEWIDSCASDFHWQLIEDLDEVIEPINIISYGVLVRESKDSITIAQNYGLNPLQCCSLMTIPRGCIKKKTVIENIKANGI